MISKKEHLFVVRVSPPPSPVTKFIVPDWVVYIVDSVIGLSYRPASLCLRQPYAGVNYIPAVRDYELATDLSSLPL
jgi:hypothetical protein